MRLLALLLALAFPLFAERIAVKYYSPSGAYVEELIEAPEGATAENFALTLYSRLAPPAEAPVSRWALVPVASSDGDVALTLSYSRPFGEFRELLPAREYHEVVTAQAGPERTVLPPPPKATFLERAAQVVADNPWKSLLGTVAVVYFSLDKFDNGDFDFSVGSSPDGGEKTPPPAPPSKDITSLDIGQKTDRVTTSSVNELTYEVGPDGRKKIVVTQPPFPPESTPGSK